MNLIAVPTYCGGKLLLGLTPVSWSKERYDLIFKAQTTIINAGSYGDQARIASGTGGGMPNTTEDVAFVLRELMSKYSNIIGTITAVTNSGQEREGAGKLLQSVGFIPAIKTEKNRGYGFCTTWVGDVHETILPTIKKLIPATYMPEVLGGSKATAKKKSLFSQFASHDL